LRPAEIAKGGARNTSNKLPGGFDTNFSGISKANAFSTERGVGANFFQSNLLLRDSLQQMPSNEIIVNCNKLAMTALSTENFKECQMYLKRAEHLVEALLDSQVRSNNPKYEGASKLYSLTMNNLGCYYKK
jgi:hypothetical protein